MGGLLYKDFVAFNRIGKVKVTWLIFAFTVLFISLRMIFPGTGAIRDLMAEDSNGDIVNLIDIFFAQAYVCFMVFTTTHISQMIDGIVDNDDKNKTRGYLCSMPFDKKTYVASKYIFIGVAAYVYMSVSYVLGISCAAFCGESRALDVTNMVNGILLSYYCIVILIAALYLPMYLLLGKEKTRFILVGFGGSIALFVVGFLMFGDLTIFADFFINLVEIAKNHMTEIMVFESLGTVITLLLYYLSYRVTCRLYIKKEV